MVESVRTQVKRKFIEFNRTLKAPFGEADILEGIRALHERLGDREFFLAYGQGMTGMRTLAEHLRTVLKERRGLRPVITGERVRLISGNRGLGRGVTALTFKTGKGREMFLRRKR